MHIGIQTTFNQPIGVARMREVAAKGFTMARIDLQQVHSLTMLDACIEEAQAAGLKPLLIVRDAEQLEWLGSGLHVELRNEPDIAVGGEMNPEDYARLVPAFVQTCMDKGHTGWIGAISNLNRHGFEWLREMLWHVECPLPECIGISVHRYPNGNNWSDPQEGARDRPEEASALRSIIGEYRRWAVSEFGYHTAKRKPKEWYRRLFWPRVYDKWTDDQAAASIRKELTFWKALGAEYAVLYQLVDGPSDTALDRYGIQRFDGTWKPQAEIIATVNQWVRSSDPEN